jgi:crotonobetainyl-CoA:carnitine CoA-transferase CaiB-like acyl-CoA transferase
MLGASNLRQQRRLWRALEQPEMAKRDNEERERDRDREAALLRETPPPELGADTEAVLAEHGYEATQIAACRRAGVV